MAEQTSEEIVWLPVAKGRVFAIVHRPAATGSLCLIMLNSGQLSRVGPQRLYVKAARELARQGITVVRVDLAGIGDAEAANPEIHFDSHPVRDVDALVRYARESLNAKHVVLQGLCAGARAALKSAAANRRVDGVIAWSCPIFSAGEGMPKAPSENETRMSESRARDSFERVGGAFRERRILTARWWRNRFRHGGEDLRRIFRAAIFLARAAPPPSTGFLESADAYLRAGRDVLFVYGRRDRIPLAEFRERFGSVPEGTSSPQVLCVVADATHTFTSMDAQNDVTKLTSEWLAARFLAPSARAARR